MPWREGRGGMVGEKEKEAATEKREVAPT